MRYLIILLLLSGCASTGEQGIRIVWHKVDGQLLMRGEKGSFFSAHGQARMIDGVCHVWAPDPPIKGEYTRDQWATLGHEIKHCFDGGFHD